MEHCVASSYESCPTNPPTSYIYLMTMMMMFEEAYVIIASSTLIGMAKSE